MKRLLAEHNSKQSEPLFPSVIEMPILIDKFDGQESEKKRVTNIFIGQINLY